MKIQKSRKCMRKTTKRNTIKRKVTKRKQSKKQMYKSKKYYGGKFNPAEEEILKKSLEKFNFTEKELEDVVKTLGVGAHYYSGHLENLISYFKNINNKEEFMVWLKERYNKLSQDDETDYESD